MRVLVYPRDLELGGSSINAIDLAAAMHAHGYEPVLLARPGPLADRIETAGIPLISVPVPDAPRPAPVAVRAIRNAVRRHRVDLVHTYEFWTCVEAFYGAGIFGTPVLGTVMTMGLAPYLPQSVPLTLGYRDLFDEARRSHRARVHLMEPPVDTSIDRPGLDPAGFLRDFDLASDQLKIVIVSRAAVAMKQEGIERAMDALARLPREPQLIVVGGGSAFTALEERAAKINAELGRRAVVLTGPLPDPRPAYAAADVVVGMGGSVLRGMAFGKPAVVVGENGFSLPVRPDTLPIFDRTGFYGVGAGRPAAEEDPLPGQLAPLLDEPDRRRSLGEFGTQLVTERFSLDAISALLDGIYRQTVAEWPSTVRRMADGGGTLARVARHKLAGRNLGRNRRPAPQGERSLTC